MSEMFANVFACQHVRLTVLKQFRISDCSIFGGVVMAGFRLWF